MNSSTSNSLPATPKVLCTSTASIARSASASVSQTITPFPAARPEALMTTGAPSSRAAPRARSASVNVRARAVGTRASSMSCFANDFEVSICAASRVGPKIGSRSARKWSTIPAASGASGPTTVSETPSRRANVARASNSVTEMGRQVASSAMPGLPGAAYSVSAGLSFLNRHARACSRPPPPTIRTFTYSFSTRC